MGRTKKADSSVEKPVEVELKIEKIASDTKVEAVHVMLNGKHYHVNKAPLPRLWTQISVYDALSNGRAVDLAKPLFQFRSNSIDEGINELKNYVDGKPYKNEEKPPMVFIAYNSIEM